MVFQISCLFGLPQGKIIFSLGLFGGSGRVSRMVEYGGGGKVSRGVGYTGGHIIPHLLKGTGAVGTHPTGMHSCCSLS